MDRKAVDADHEPTSNAMRQNRFVKRGEHGVLSMISVSCFRVRGFAQLLILCAAVEGVPRRHKPDFLLVTDDGPVIVDVRCWA